MRANSVLIAVATLASVPVAALAGPFDSIVGDALRVEAQVSSRFASLAIPRTELQQIPGSFQWAWQTTTPLPLTTNDGFTLASITGRVVYDTQFDNILLDFNVLGGANDVFIRLRTARLDDSFSFTAESLDVNASLQDLNANGASVFALPPDGQLFSLVWNSSPVLRAFLPYSVSAGGLQDSMDAKLLDSPALIGGKEVRASFGLTAQDRFQASVSAITSIPTPGVSAVLVIGGFWRCRRRR